MSTADLLQAYGVALDANSALNSAYYDNPHPTLADRADYHRRIERMEQLRERVYSVLDEGPVGGVKHLLLNRIHVILGYADLLAESCQEPHTLDGLRRIHTTAVEVTEIIRSSLH